MQKRATEKKHLFREDDDYSLCGIEKQNLFSAPSAMATDEIESPAYFKASFLSHHPLTTQS